MNMILAAATLRSHEARALVAVMCGEAAPHQRIRKRQRRHFKSALMRVIKFAKHETLRKMHRYLHAHRPLMGQEHPGTMRIAFDPAELQQDLQSMLYSEMPQMLEASAASTVESLGAGPFKMASQDVLDFISRRVELLSGLPDELFKRITDELSTGLSAGENLSQLSDRIAQAFSDIEQGMAEVIADTETAAAFNYATDKAARSAGVTHKQWVHGGSKVPRADHLAIDGLVVPFDEPYPVGNPPLMFPHAPDGSPEDVINCSCVSIPVDTSSSEGESNA
jgi:uncharacterized protein with gpF-like domain